MLGRILVVSVLLVTSYAQAEPPSWYFGAGITGTRAPSVQDICDDFAQPGLSLDCQETALSGKGFVGARINKYFSVEGSLAYLGQFDFTATVNGAGSGTAKWKGYAGMLEALGTLPVTEGLDLYIRGGAAYWYTDVDVTVPGLCSSCYSQSATGFSPTAGLGLQWWLAHNLNGPGSLALRLEYQQIWNVGDQDKTGQTDLQMVSLSFLWRF